MFLHVTEVPYLGLIVTTKGIKMDPTKVTAIRDWPEPQNISDVRCLLGFANFYKWVYKRILQDCVELRPQGAHSLELATSSLFGLRYFILYGTSTLFYIPSSRAQHVYN